MRISTNLAPLLALVTLGILAASAASEPQKPTTKEVIRRPPPPPDDNKELARWFDEEQADHAPPAGKTAEGTASAARQRVRVERVRELNAQNKLRTGADFYRASVMLQRGDGPDDYRLGQQLKAAALKLGWPHHHFHTGPEQNCNAAIPVCQNSYTQSQSYIGVGPSQEVAAGTCLGTGESNSVWYIFTAQTSGSLTFTINTAKDYDFALYNISNGGCAAIPSSTPIRCNYSATLGQTGLNLPAAPELPALSVNAGGAPMMSGLNVTAGQTYVLLVNNYTGDQNGYTLTFGGTASIFDNTPPSFVSAIMDAASCEIEITMNEPVHCSSIASNGSDFQLLTNGGSVVTGASGVNCGAFTNKIRLTFSLNSADTCVWSGSGINFWFIRSKAGADGNTLVDNCGNSIASGSMVAVVTPPTAVPQLTLPNNVTSFCKGASIIANGSSSNAIRHFWSIAQTDANGWTFLGPEYSDWFTGPAGSFDINQFAALRGLVFECDKFYLIKLAVGGCCTPWKEVTKVIKITCQGATAAFTLPKTEYCPGEPIIADGSPSQNETNNFWSIQESDQNWNRYGPEISDWYVGPAGSKDLTQLAASRNFWLVCNSYYRIGLAVAGCGSPWNATTQLIRISCPEAGPDRQVCCNSSYPVQIGNPPIAGVTYSWTSNPPGFTSSIANPMVNPTGTTVYRLTAVGPNGCTTTDSVTLTCLSGRELKIDISTGVTGGVKHAYGTPDTDWRMRSVPGTIYGGVGGFGPPTFSVKPQTVIWPPWASNPFANWISPQANPSDGTVPMQAATQWPPDPNKIDYFYEYRFFFDPSQFTSPVIEIIQMAVDNNAQIYLNSQALWGNPNNYTDVGLNWWLDSHFAQMNGPFQVTSGFVNGWNVLHVRVRNGGGPWGPTSPTGLLIRGNFKAQCK